VPTEHPELHLRIDEHGAVRRASAHRWGTSRYASFFEWTIGELQPSGHAVA
jgi:hypothetical protein